jgi:hypothetical protein
MAGTDPRIESGDGYPEKELSLLDESGATSLSCFAGEDYPHQSPNG